MSSEHSTIRRAVAPAPGRASGGLGRGLAGILGDVGPTLASQHRGLQQLLGRSFERSMPRIRQFVTDTALAAMAEGFEAEAVVIARRDGTGLPAVVSSRIPPSWEEMPGLTFELFGQLWRLLDEVTVDGGDQSGPAGDGPGRRGSPEGRSRRDGRRVTIGEHRIWLGHQRTVEGHLVAAVARRRPFGREEDAVLGRLVRSLAVAVGAEGPVLPDGSTDLIVTGGPGRFEAVLHLTLDGRTRRAGARGDTPELAVARAAASASGVACEVTFAGRTRVEGADVTVVVVNDGAASPLLGIAVTCPGDDRGPVEAVVSAVTHLGTRPADGS